MNICEGCPLADELRCSVKRLQGDQDDMIAFMAGVSRLVTDIRENPRQTAFDLVATDVDEAITQRSDAGKELVVPTLAEQPVLAKRYFAAQDGLDTRIRRKERALERLTSAPHEGPAERKRYWLVGGMVTRCSSPQRFILRYLSQT